MEQAYAENHLAEAIADFKQRLFGREDLILHTADITRNRNGFKDAHLARYGLAALDPYLLSLDVLVERFCMELGHVEGGGLIVAERRGPTLDREIELAWLSLKIQGTRYISATQVDARITGLVLRAKQERVPGLELADLVVTPIGRYVLGKKIKEDFEVVRSKFRTNHAGRFEGYGLVVLPRPEGQKNGLAPATQ